MHLNDTIKFLPQIISIVSESISIITIVLILHVIAGNTQVVLDLVGLDRKPVAIFHLIQFRYLLLQPESSRNLAADCDFYRTFL